MASGQVSQKNSLSSAGELEYYKVFYYTNAKQRDIPDKEILEKFSPKPRDKHIDFWPRASVAYVRIDAPGLDPISKVHYCCQQHWKMKMHPEEQFLLFLEALIKAGKEDLTCTVYENNSPCHKCLRALHKFHSTHRKKLKGLYIHYRHFFTESRKKAETQQELESLAELDKVDIKLFTPATWQKLLEDFPGHQSLHNALENPEPAIQ